jgi:hypothetical protein
MRIAAAVFADFERTFLGAPSVLRLELAGRSVMEHTLRRLLRIDGLDACALVVRPRDEAAAREALRSIGAAGAVELLAIDDAPRFRHELILAARKWNLDGWRGTPLGTTWFDEFVEPSAAAKVLNHYGYEAVFCVDGQQAALDTAIATNMVAYAREHEADAGFVFTQAPPGLAGLVLGRECVRELVENRWPFGLLLSYRPERPIGDPITRPVCLQIDGAVAQTACRFLPDTQRSRRRLADALAELGPDCGAAALCAWVQRVEGDGAAPVLPLEVELELTTDDPLPETTLRPRGGRVPRRALDDLDAVSRLARELAGQDDALVCLGGHGDPLAHPGFADVVQRVRAAGVCGISVATPLVRLPDAAFEALFEQRVDSVEVLLDAATAETYRRLHGRDEFAAVIANVERLLASRRDRQRPRPLVLCSLMRCAGNADELEAFYDHWTCAASGAVLRGYNEYCGGLPADALTALEPPVRGPCRRLDRRLILLADGTVPYCSQDVTGTTRLGDWRRQPLADIWDGEPLRALRADHASLSLARHALCPLCREWFRP